MACRNHLPRPAVELMDDRLTIAINLPTLRVRDGFYAIISPMNSEEVIGGSRLAQTPENTNDRLAH